MESRSYQAAKDGLFGYFFVDMKWLGGSYFLAKLMISSFSKTTGRHERRSPSFKSSQYLFAILIKSFLIDPIFSS
jgi:hypothetical protein